MTTKCIGEFPLDVLYPPEILELIEHDKSSSVKYVETLKVYLDSSLSITNTSKTLGIHRSTLIARIKNISSVLAGSLDDPDYRLLLNILLKAYQK
ncbi:MAG: helix-turn-helix domain-containing protein [Eubacterium callanderi]